MPKQSQSLCPSTATPLLREAERGGSSRGRARALWLCVGNVGASHAHPRLVRLPSCSGLKAYSAVFPGGSDLAGARGDTILPYPIGVLFQHLVIDAAKHRRDFDTQLDRFIVLAQPSPQHRIERTLYKGFFPTDPRDFVVLQGWEATPEGGFLIYTTSVIRSDAPEVKGFVRGTLDIGGWLVQPISAEELATARAEGMGPKGATFEGPSRSCRVTRLFRTSIGGGVPVMLVRTASAAQAQVPLQLHKMLQKRIARDGSISDAAVSNIETRVAVDPPASSIAPDAPPDTRLLPVGLDAPLPREQRDAPGPTGEETLESVPPPSDSEASSVMAAPTFSESFVAAPQVEPDDASDDAFRQPPELPEPYATLRAETAAKMCKLFDDAFADGGPKSWKFTGQGT